jgi:SPP1 gp7 family putative phage head morphogenesis protein
MEGATFDAMRAGVHHATESFDLHALAAEVNETMMRGAMLGILDANHEAVTGHDDPTTRLAQLPLPFARLPFTEAVEFFRRRKVLPRPAFDAIEYSARRQAFTVAGLARDELMAVVHAELAKRYQESQRNAFLPKTADERRAPDAPKPQGPQLRDFRKFMRERLESAGWTPASPSHVETIFRTNTMSAYGSGRFAQQSQPLVKAALPYWQIRAITDARARDTHKAANGRVLSADDPFWQRAYPPFGFNCRCKTIARTKAWVGRTGITIGPVPTGLPDPGFASGTNALLLPVPQMSLVSPTR